MLYSLEKFVIIIFNVKICIQVLCKGEIMIVKNEEVRFTTVDEGVERKILATGGNMMTVEVKLKKGAIGAVHTHPHEQIGYVVSGSFELDFEGEKHLIKAGDTYYVKPNQAHGVLALEDSVIIDVFTPQREDFLE